MFSSTLLSSLTLLLVSSASLTLASPVWPRFTVSHTHLEVLALRAATSLNPAAVRDVTCIDHSRNIVFHDENAAELSICGGIEGPAAKRCEGAPERTSGSHGTAEFVLRPEVPGATINVSKSRWEQCVRAARAVCPTGSMRGTCLGGASRGDLTFVLDAPGETVEDEEL
ncbi:hypothetical protein F5X96DRAFT_648512 [Biscogniauxia mediterranea]|nr:hypothetical protein F5X96DRAFT_648512 [Biscogniauxia mediterranea]